jgi:hypothetical protein
VTDFVCEVEEYYRSACEGLPFYAEHEGKRYCVLHFPDNKDKKDDLKKVLESKLAEKDYDFVGTVFPEGGSDFQGLQFDADTFFDGAAFLGEADFSGAQFSGEGTSFSAAQFSGRMTDFSAAQFSGEVTVFREAEFSGEATADFRRATFEGEVDFSGSAFRTFAYFREATFRQGVRFLGPGTFDSQALVSFVDARIDKPELFSFDRVVLRPSWFIGVEALKFHFTNVWWHGLLDRSEGGLDEEIEQLQSSGVAVPHLLLTRTCRELSTNADENHEDPVASEFNYWANDALRKDSWIRHRLPLRLTSYWILNGYGERPLRAVVVLTLIIVAFAFLYMLAGPPEMRVHLAEGFWHHIEGFVHSLVYSLSVISRLSPEPKPNGPSFFQFLVSVEGILSILQIALVVLAFRRKGYWMEVERHGSYEEYLRGLERLAETERETKRGE